MQLRCRVSANARATTRRRTISSAAAPNRARATPDSESNFDESVDVEKKVDAVDVDVVGRRSSLLVLVSSALSLPAVAAAAAARADPISSTAQAAAAATNLDVGALAVKSLKSKVSDGVGSFLRERQRADGGARLLAPVRNARRRLRDAAAMLLAALDGAEPAAVARAAEREGGQAGGSGDEGHEAALSGRLFGGDGRKGRAAPSSASSSKSNSNSASSRSSERVRSIFKSSIKRDKSKTKTADGLPRPAAFKPILEAVRAGSGECFSFDALDGALPLPQSLVGGAGAANCTLSLVARNAVATLPRSSSSAASSSAAASSRASALSRATLDESEAAIGAIRLVDDLLERAAEGDRAAAEGVAAALERALRSVAALEGLVAACLNYDGEMPTSDYGE